MTGPFSFEDVPQPIRDVTSAPSPQPTKGATAGADRPPPSHPEPKIPPPPLMGRAARPSAVRIRKPVVQAMVAGAALLLSGSLAWAFILQPDMKARAREFANAERLDERRGAVRPSERVSAQPSSYDRLATDANGLPAPRASNVANPADPTVSAPARVGAQTYGPSPAAFPSAPGPAQQAAASSLFFGGGAMPTPPAGSVAAAEPSVRATPAPVSRDHGAIYNPHGLISPVSPYELKAGAIVSGVLLTGVDTSRPGPVVASVSQNVFDTITGRHLLLPQGTRLIGRHEGESAYGDRRAFLIWDRMILPNGKSILLSQEPGVDATGAVGVRGQTSRHLWSMGIASLFAGAITTLGELARGGSSDDRSVIASAGDAASIEASQVGGRLIDRELQVRPSIRVRAGAPVRVMITRDLILEPYSR